MTNAEKDSTGRATGLPGYRSLNLSEVLDQQDAITSLKVPVSSNPNDGFLRTDDASTAYVFKSDLTYDAKADTFTDANGVVYTDNGKGEFQQVGGTKTLSPGWKVDVGFQNFVKAFTNPQLAGPLWKVIIWTFVFAFLSVATTFALGLFLAIVLNHPRLRGKKIYRVLVILPYAFPAFLSGLVWAGLLNPEFGFVNQVLLGGAQIPWLTDPWLARLSVIGVNLWLGYPYMFLVCTGALQSLPEEVDEAARVDGASPWRIFRSIKLPLLLVSVAPLLIASLRVQLQQLQRDLHAHARLAAVHRHHPRHRVHRPADHDGLQGGLRTGRGARLRTRQRTVDPHLHPDRDHLDHRVPQDQGARGDQLMKKRPFNLLRWFGDTGWRHLVGIALVVVAVFPLLYVLSASLNPGGSLVGSNALFSTHRRAELRRPVHATPTSRSRSGSSTRWSSAS